MKLTYGVFSSNSRVAIVPSRIWVSLSFKGKVLTLSPGGLPEDLSHVLNTLVQTLVFEAIHED